MVRERGRSHYQLSNIKRKKEENYQLSTVNCQLSTIDCQLSTGFCT
ncbi:MAG: hypothetical protein HC849_30600 [Oscillatoriales cyanobacterium RU_3_3]|nr:hypothetical protein [Oscillatoriales cyanobacterium RU_3_3]NJR21891.1 hypothetical protein [Richelia sp. CSU_2_1]